MTVTLVAVNFEALDSPRVARFWADLLGREVREDGPDALLLPGDELQVGLRFSASTAEKAAPNLIHLHLTSSDAADQDHTVTTALRLGGRQLDIGQRPEEGHVVLADPEGNELCVIEPGNRFLAGCGKLGEVACDGSRSVGQFWSTALQWPLVWDQDEETAVQSPRGGTKIAWGGPPLLGWHGGRRQQFVLSAPGELRTELDRLISLGAAMINGDDGAVTLADLDGNSFLLRT